MTQAMRLAFMWLLLGAATILLMLYAVDVKAQGLRPCAAINTLAPSTASTSVQLSACGPVAVVWNVGTVEAFLVLGNSGVIATTSGISLPGGSFMQFNVGYDAPYLAAITSAGSTTLRITQGLIP